MHLTQQCTHVYAPSRTSTSSAEHLRLSVESREVKDWRAYVWPIDLAAL